MASRADCVASSAGNLALHQTCLQNHHGFLEATADDLCETSHDFSVWTLFCALEQQRPAFDTRVLVLQRIATQQIKYAVVVDLVHGYDDSILGARVSWKHYIRHRGGLRQRRWSRDFVRSRCPAHGEDASVLSDM